MIRATWFALLIGLLVPTVARADLYAWWPLDDGSGDSARNLAPGGEEGFIEGADTGGLGDGGSVWVDDDERGVVLGVDGAWVEAGEVPVMSLEQDFTWAFWAKQHETQASPSNVIIAGNRYGQSGSDTSPREFIKFTPNRFEYHMDAGVALTTNPDGTQEFLDDLQYIDCDYCPERHIPSDPSEWIHHAVIKDGNTLTYYRNGEFGNTKLIETEQFSPDPLPFFMGGQNGVELWRGYLSDMRLYDHAISEQELAELLGGSSLAGDYNADGMLDAQDIDLQAAAMRSASPDLSTFDENGDGLVDAADRLIWINDHRKTWVGDADLDGDFDSGDFVAVFTAGKYETPDPAGWAEGDWDGNGTFNSGDFVAAFSNGGYELGPRAAVQAVPEPSGILMVIGGVAALVVARRRTMGSCCV